MLLPKGGVNWKSAQARIPPYRVLRHNFTRSRILSFVIIVTVTILLWGGITTSSREMQKLVSPIDPPAIKQVILLERDIDDCCQILLGFTAGALQKLQWK